jgi:hypothetical protein
VTNTPDTLFTLASLKDGPNCGVTAVAIAAGVSLDEAMAVIRKIKGKSRRWKGGTLHKDRILALEHFKVAHKAYSLKDRRKLYTWARDRAEPGKLYMLRVTGHVILLKDGWCMDQSGPRRIEAFRCRNRFLTHVVEIEQ